jgi:hypothetical protein
MCNKSVPEFSFSGRVFFREIEVKLKEIEMKKGTVFCAPFKIG